MKTLSRLTLAFGLMLFTGCATVFGGTTDEVAINSVPTGATVRSGETILGTTPLIANVSRSADYLTFEHPAHGRRKVPLDSSFRFGALFCDILFTPGFGSSGILIDTIAQAWWDHPANVMCDFAALPEAEPEPETKAAPDDDDDWDS